MFHSSKFGVQVAVFSNLLDPGPGGRHDIESRNVRDGNDRAGRRLGRRHRSRSADTRGRHDRWTGHGERSGEKRPWRAAARPAAHRAACDHGAARSRCRRTESPRHQTGGGAGRKLRRSRVWFHRATRHGPAEQPLRQQPRRRARSRRPDRELADGHLHEKGPEVRRDRQGAVWPGEYQQRLQGLRRHMRSAQQRRRRRAVRPVGRPLAYRDADFRPRRGAGRSTRSLERRRSHAAQPAGCPGPARPGNDVVPAAAAAPAATGRGRPACAAAARPGAAGAASLSPRVRTRCATR